MTGIDWNEMKAAAAKLRAEDTPAANPVPKPPPLEFTSFADLAARVDARGPRSYLLRALWPAGDYGVHAGEMKSQKTWNTVDAVVSVAAGTDWLGAIPVDKPGAVLMFVGEGGEANLVRRVRAVAAAVKVDPAQLAIVVCTRVPHLSDAAHLGNVADALDRHRPVLTTVDPLYLAARGAKGSDLYAMGEVLETVQHMCQQADSGLWVTTHHNRKDGRGAGRITGAGPAEWGRVLINATVVSRHSDPATRETTVVTELDVIGGEVADTTLRVVRRIRVDGDPDDINAPLLYRMEASEISRDTGAGDDMPPARRKLYEALQAAGGDTRTAGQLVDWIAAKHGHGLTRPTTSSELNALLKAGLADCLAEPGRPSLWFLTGGKP